MKTVVSVTSIRANIVSVLSETIFIPQGRAWISGENAMSTMKIHREGSLFGIDGASKRGRYSKDEWQMRARFVLRHLDDPITLQSSPLCRLAALDRLARAKYSDSIVPRGRALHELSLQCLREIESELDGHAGVAKLKQFIMLTRQGKKVTEASRDIGITPEYASRALKRQLVDLLTEKLILRLH